jgi:multiple sugar transport system substrate-binding protein
MYKRMKYFLCLITLIALTLSLVPARASATNSIPVQIRWFVGLGTGSDPGQIAIEQEVVDDFNATHSDIQLTLDVVPFDQARAVLADQIANGNSPDIVGPVGWGGSNAFHDQWLDLDPLITAASYDTSQFPQELVDLYQTDLGQEGLPFALFPSALYFNAPMFVNAGLYYPPARYGEQYEMPDGTLVDWNWDTIATIGKLLTLDASGKNATELGFDTNNISLSMAIF